MKVDYTTKYLKYKKKYLNLKKNINISGGGLKEVILFKASWCGHCKNFIPIWDSMKKKYKGKIWN